MVFNDTSTYLGICQEIDQLCDTDTTSYPVAHKTRRVNSALETVIGWILEADGTWQFDDSNHTDLPIGTQTLVAAQKAYTFNDKFLQLLSVEVKNADGDWGILTPIDQRDFSEGIPLEQEFETDGLPEYYDKVSDDTIKLYPGPSATYCTLTSGLKIRFKRTAHLFTASDTTAEPGFQSPYHVILAYMASIPYCMTYKPNRVPLYEKKVMEIKDGLIKAYSLRQKDTSMRLHGRGISFR